MRIERIVYAENGRPMIPHSTLGMVQSLFPSNRPTTDVGCFHRHKIVEGATLAQAHGNLNKFKAVMEQVPGFSVADAREYTVNMGGYRRIGVEILYMVEDIHITDEQKALTRRIPQPLLMR